MIDLHTHTSQSDGTFSPAELVREAVSIGLEAMAISDHDTLTGYEAATETAQAMGFDLICGIELSTKFHGYAAHLLGYFLHKPPEDSFRNWLGAVQRSRHERNVRLIDRLQALGVDITLAEVEAKGKSLTGRPHFAKVLVEKGYVEDITQAFQEFLDESAKGYVERQEPDLADAVAAIANSGGLPSIAHPIRLARNDYLKVDELVREMKDFGLRGLEVYHSDHKPADVEHYRALAGRFGLVATGGSDFHGANKPNIRLGKGINGNLDIPATVLEKLRELS
ncbi:MAG: PHP domain-containing protein [Acidobacteriota bacterium]|nr:PHP domain-containing protein [Acidobacteriota bacterium]